MNQIERLGLSGRIENLDFLLKAVTQLHFSAFGIIMGLDAGPELDGGAEVARKPQRRVGADAALLMANFTDPHGGYADVLGQPVLADAHRLQKLLQENFAGMNGGKIPHDNTSMIVDDFNMMNAVIMPLEANPPLAVDADRVLTGAVTAQRLQAVGRWYAKVGQRFGKMQHGQFSCSQPLNVLRQFF